MKIEDILKTLERLASTEIFPAHKQEWNKTRKYSSNFKKIVPRGRFVPIKIIISIAQIGLWSKLQILHL